MDSTDRIFLDTPTKDLQVIIKRAQASIARQEKDNQLKVRGDIQNIKKIALVFNKYLLGQLMIELSRRKEIEDMLQGGEWKI